MLAYFEHTLGVIAVALLIDAVVGDPDAVWRRLPHPVALVGRLIAALDRTLNAGRYRRAKGIVAVAIAGAVVVGVGAAIAALLGLSDGGWLIEAALASVLIAQNSLVRHFSAVATPLAAGDLAGARAALARIVGRDVESLDESGVARAAIESLAESTSDGVVAPVFWGALFGLPGLLVYKAVNTADSMIGHRDARYAEFGWAAARLDDLLNLAPARLTGLLFVVAAWLMPGARAGAAFSVMRRDAPNHASPNAGFPEAAMAGALGLKLGGPRSYDGEMHHAFWLGDGRAEAAGDDLARAIRLSKVAMILHASLIALLWLWLSR